jgi:hypothetical protein
MDAIHDEVARHGMWIEDIRALIRQPYVAYGLPVPARFGGPPESVPVGWAEALRGLHLTVVQR